MTGLPRSGPDFPYPPRVSLGCFPTRIHFLEQSPGGPEVFIKRDDESGSELSGNKVRKLEFLLSEALEGQADLVVTCGAVQSNHCRAAAVAARRLGLDSLLFLRGTDPGERDGNLLLDVLAGAELRFVTPEEYADRARLMEEAAGALRARGRRPYVIPEGGSNALGSVGYVRMIDELLEQGDPVPGRGRGDRCAWDHIVCATGSGGTLAGLLLGAKLRPITTQVWGINVCDTARYFEDRILEIAAEFRERFLPSSEPLLQRSDIRVIEGYKGPGYGKAPPPVLELIREAARRKGLFLDPVYTGKALYGLEREIERGRFGAGERVLFLHTGGIFSLFPWKRELAG